MKYYYILAKEFAEPILSMHPKAAQYNDKKLILSRTEPKDFKGEVVDLSQIDDNNEEETSYTNLVLTVNQMLLEVPTGRLVKISITPQGKYLYANHLAFKPEVTTDDV